MRITHFIHTDQKTVTEYSNHNEIELIFATMPERKFVAVTEGNQLVGSISRTPFLSTNKENFSVHNVLDKKFLYDYYHILESIREFMKDRRTELPVVDELGDYLGICKLSELQHHFYHTMGITEGGSLIIIRTKLQNYSLVDVAKIVESNQAKVLTHYVSTHPDTEDIEITLVLNQNEVSDIIATFERFNYETLYASTASDREDFLKERYDSLMHYLDI